MNSIEQLIRKAIKAKNEGDMDLAMSFINAAYKVKNSNKEANIYA